VLRRAEDGETTEAAKDAMAQLAALFIRAAELGVLRAPLVREVSDEMAAMRRRQAPRAQGAAGAGPRASQAMIQAWATLHGITTLDAYVAVRLDVGRRSATSSS
jgi:hypothetical protein